MRSARLVITLATLSCAAATLRAQENRTISVGQTLSGELRDTDPQGVRTRKAPYHVWNLDGRRGQHVMIDVRSDAFDAYLVLRDETGFVIGSDDDAGGGTNARLHTVLPRDGRYRIVVTAVGDSARGAYELTVSGWEAPNAPPPGVASTINLGETKDGMLEPGDEIAGDGPFLDRWVVNLRAGQRARADLHSSDFDSYLVVRGPDGTILGTDDDSGEGRDASLGFRASVAGAYTVIATSYDDNPRIGSYRLTVVEETGTYADPGTTQQIRNGETREGRLESGDTRGHRGYEDRWTFEGRQGQLARVDVRSSRFDAFAELYFNGMQVDSNDDGGDGNNARLMTVLPQTGTYTVVVTQYSESGSGGRYDIALAVSDAPPGAGNIQHITPGQQVSGRLEPGDRPRSGGGYQDVWEFDGRANQDVTIEMHSSDFDSYLELRDDQGALIAENDDGGDGQDALILTRLPRNGTYRIIARSYGDHESTGLYELSFSAGGDVGRPGRPAEIREGQTVMGRLEPGDSLVGDSTFADVYTFRASRDGEIQVDLRSGDFDAYLIVRDARGGTLATDDDGAGEGTNSRITLPVRNGQVYRIYANSYGDDRATGMYRLTVRYR